MTNKEIAEKIYNSYFEVTGDNDKEMAKKHGKALVDTQIRLMYQDMGTVIIDTDREMFAEDWEEVKYFIKTM
jgi:hypothetical protein